MTDEVAEIEPLPCLLNAVALFSDIPEQGLFRGQMGTIVETLDEKMALAEFSDDRGRANAITRCSLGELLVLRNRP